MYISSFVPLLQSLFSIIGKVMILQPHDEMSFVNGEGLHPMLPDGAGLYMLRPPPNTTNDDMNESSVLRTNDVMASIDTISSSRDSSSFSDESSSPSQVDDEARAVPSNLREALWELMNNPHPLDILADPAAYGTTGGISRYHNPDHYTKALGGVLRTRSRPWRNLVERAAAVGIRHHVPAVVPAVREKKQEESSGEMKRSPSAGGKSHLGLARHLHA